MSETKTKSSITTTQSGVVHFRIGEDFGALLMSIAQEHLTERNDPVQALKTITESLQGCPTELAVQILKGDIVLFVDKEKQQVIPTKRIPAIHDKLFPKINPIYFLESRTSNIKRYGGSILDGFVSLQTQIKMNRGYFDISFKYEDVFKFIAGDNETLLEELREDREIDGIASLFETVKRFIGETMKIQSVMAWMAQTFNEFLDTENHEKYLKLHKDIIDLLVDISFQLNKTINLDFDLNVPTDSVTDFINAAREIDVIIEKGIEPVNILDNWSAGWLAPNGDYYGLNGEIANMIHNQIADALKEKGLIPEDEVSLDAWLEQQGWVKIHGDNVQFAGCLNDKIHGKNVDITKEQIKAIYEYISICHNGVVKLGWKREAISIAKFNMLADNNLPAMYKMYFEF
jgi:hypothetical protein